jgi:hypothetical protein
MHSAVPQILEFSGKLKILSAEIPRHWRKGACGPAWFGEG